MKIIACSLILLVSSSAYAQRPADRNLAHKRVRMDVSTAAPSSAIFSNREAQSTNADLQKAERQAIRAESQPAERTKMHSFFKERYFERREQVDDSTYGFRPRPAHLSGNVGRGNQREAAGRKGIHRGWVTGR